METATDRIGRGVISGGSIDRSVMYLVAGVGVLLFFALTMAGMSRVNDIAEGSVRGNTPTFGSASAPPRQPAAEIGGLAPAE